MATTHAARDTGERRQHGLTLLELAVVVAITAIVAATAAPSFTALIDARRLDSAATRLAADINVAAWDETGDRFLAWHCIVTLRGDGWTIGAAGNERRICRYVPAPTAAIDANIAAAGEDVDVGTALLGRNFLVVGGGDRCPGEPRTEPYQP
jgi:prepilin-type N-terminal cleavage/methylation domain-containing protein